jgi:hypothetical protein
MIIVATEDPMTIHVNNSGIPFSTTSCLRQIK